MANAKDYKKESKELYQPKTKPSLIEVPEMQFAAVEGKGNPNDAGGEYQKAVELLYAVQYTIKMSKMGTKIPDGYFDYVVPPLEGFWWLENNPENIYDSKSKFRWLSLMRLPEFVNETVFHWACAEAAQKKKLETAKAKFTRIHEGLCVQCMHIGSYDREPQTLKLMDTFIEENHLLRDLGERKHHEIYLSNPQKTEASKLKTILRIPVKRKE
ncbi:MAG: GyrI-like domain-containing protein [Bacteroidales bacterium]|nr:GyrI-like domain-containing protein [Bacteroidales bacterium]